MRLRWWQRLVLARVLEVDADESLVWLSVLLSTPRQVGKSWLLRALAMWRIHQRGRFGEEQTVMHISRGLSASREVQRAARVWARTRKADGYGAREQNGAQEVSCPDGSRWLIRDQDGVYSYSASLALVDEAWGVDPAHIDEGLEPTLPERAGPQLVLVSTAHRRCTPLMVRRRAAALERMSAPGNGLIVEWSAPAGAELDMAAARAASPFWSPGRETLAAAALERALAGGGDPAGGDDPADAFDTQHLNRWPTAPTRPSGRPESLLAEGVWAGLADLNVAAPPSPVVAVEDRTGAGCAVAASGALPGSRLLVWGREFSSRAEAAAWIRMLAPQVVLAGAALIGDETLAGLPVRKAGQAETSAGLPKLRELAGEGRLVHDGGPELAQAMGAARVAERAAGLTITVGRAELVRVAAWAVREAAAQPGDEGGVY